jgi:hypothetical protein
MRQSGNYRPPRETSQAPGRPRRKDATPFVVLLGLGVAAASVFAVWTLASGASFDVDLGWESFRPSEEETSGAVTTGPSQPLTASPSPTPGLPAVSGSPFSLSTLEKAWQGKGMTLFSGGAASGFSGQAVTPNAVRAERGSESAMLGVLVYPNSSVIKQDWNLSAGQAPSPAGGRTVPADQSTWWNQNVVVGHISGSTSVANDAKAAFLAL